jgi:anti-anti-sigma factor
VSIDQSRNQTPRASTESEDLHRLIALGGEIDHESISSIEHELGDAATPPEQHVTLDMSGLRLIDGAAITSVLQGMHKLQAAGTDLEVRYPSPMALQLFEVCSLIQIVGIEFALDPQRLPRAQAHSEESATL